MSSNTLDLMMIFPAGGLVFFTNFKYHLGSAYIIGYLRQHGYTAEQFLSSETFNVAECVNKIMNYNPKIVGFTVYESNFMQCALICNGLKSLKSNIITIFGGPTPTVQSKEIMDSVRCVDLCVRGGGEETVLQLLSAFRQEDFKLDESIIKNIKNITYRSGDKIISNPDIDILHSNRLIKHYIDKYPSPYLSKVIPSSEAYPIGIVTARGCNQNCTYCNCAIVNNKNVYFHSVDRVIQELSYLNEKKDFSGPIAIYDDTFTLIPSRAKKICEKIIENEINIPLGSSTRCDKIDKELLDLMKKAGFQAIGFSLESAVPRILRAIGKVNPPENNTDTLYRKEKEYLDKLKEMTSYAKKIGIKQVYASIMIGLPGETLKDAKKTLKFLKRLKIDFYAHNYLHIFKGTPLYQNYKKYGYIVNPISKKNKIMLENNHPFDVYKIKLGKNCSTIQNSKSQDYFFLNLLSLLPRNIVPNSYFNNVIINSDIIKPNLTPWLQENLAINGVLIQIHSSKEEYLKYKETNKSALYDNLLPTCQYQPYYFECSHNKTYLKPARFIYFDEEVGLQIKLQNTYSTLESSEEIEENRQYTLCQDFNTDDTIALFDLLVKLSEKENPFNYLLKSRILPQFQNLCRWTGNKANCQFLETAIIDADDSIRICYHSEPIGKVGSPFSDLKQNLQLLLNEIIKIRNCRECHRNSSCLKCPFPFPLSSKEYCELRKRHDTVEPAGLITKYNLIKDYIFRPVDLHNF
ncbi:MAG: B12-binding domain-containing radical SAM protein [Candidatus Thorarchaeota archaeon]